MRPVSEDTQRESHSSAVMLSTQTGGGAGASLPASQQLL